MVSAVAETAPVQGLGRLCQNTSLQNRKVISKNSVVRIAHHVRCVAETQIFEKKSLPQCPKG